MKKELKIIFIILSAVLVSCKEPYTPPAIKATANNYLVVEGIINTGNDSTKIKLSRTVNVGKTVTANPEAGAKVTVESDAGASYPLIEIMPGNYIHPPLNASSAAKYRLRIITADNKTYLSDFVVVRESPPIDSLGYATPADGLQVFVNTHDPNNNTRYYRWDYSETWQFHVTYESDYIQLNDSIYYRDHDQMVFICWKRDSSSNVVLASSAKLTKDVIAKAPITIVPSSSEKISMEYSILVTQYALTEDAFNFWQLMKTNTENLGSIFDAQPSATASNIHNINNINEPVIGYISAGTIQQKRLFVHNVQLPPTWGETQADAHCLIDTITKADFNNYIYGSAPTFYILKWYIVIPPGLPPDTIGVIATGRACADCTLTGTNKQPAYWK